MPKEEEYPKEQELLDSIHLECQKYNDYCDRIELEKIKNLFENADYEMAVIISCRGQKKYDTYERVIRLLFRRTAPDYTSLSVCVVCVRYLLVRYRHKINHRFKAVSHIKRGKK